MVSYAEFRSWAMAFPEVTEEPHFEKTSFRIRKKIFATLDEKNGRAVLKLSPLDQDVFSAFDHTVIYPLNGGWGRQGWTAVELKKVRKPIFKEALKTAYC